MTTRSDFLPNPTAVVCVHCGRSITNPTIKCDNCRTYVHKDVCEMCPHKEIPSRTEDNRKCLE